MDPKKRANILFWGGLIGLIVYFVVTEVVGLPFHTEWIIGFLAMTGVGVAQGVDKK